MQAGAAGFISGGGSLLLGFSAAAGSSTVRSKLSCGSINVGNALASGGFAAVGGIGGRIAGAFVPPKYVTVRRGFFGRVGQRLGLLGPKKIDTRTSFRNNLSAATAATIDNSLSGAYSGSSLSGNNNCGCP